LNAHDRILGRWLEQFNFAARPDKELQRTLLAYDADDRKDFRDYFRVMNMKASVDFYGNVLGNPAIHSLATWGIKNRSAG
jgi:hypothetical protein